MNVILKCFSKSGKVHNGGQTIPNFCLIQRSTKLHYPISLSVKIGVHSCFEEVKTKELYWALIK